MSPRPNWYDNYWEKIDPKTEKKLRTMCPRCGSSETYYNKRYSVWRCANCEHAFRIEGLGERKNWWRRLFRR